MPKKRTSTPQPTLFRREIPQMPEGYYSSKPNPNLHRFVEEHATPYDPAMDDYNVPAFDQPITTTKMSAIYNMHTYWSKKPHDAIQQYIQHYTKQGDIVFDPFCGSGGTALAALMKERAAIAIDLSPAATFITKNYCTPVDIDEFQRAFEELATKVKPEMDWLYETRCDRCDGRATVISTVFSGIYACSRCLSKIPLFDCVEVQSQNKKGEPKKIRVCPKCFQMGIIEEISTRQEKYGVLPVLVIYNCEDGCKPQRNERRHNDTNSKKREYFQKYDLKKINEIRDKPIPYWHPEANLEEKIPYRMLHKKDFRKTDAQKLTELFTKRNLWALSTLFYYANRSTSKVRDILLFAITGLIQGLSRMNQYRPEVSFPLNTMVGTYYLPQIFVEAYVWLHYKNKIERLKKGYLAIVDSISEEPKLLISTQSATEVDLIPSNSIDYIFTDPPYAGNVQYGELNFLWEAWLGFNESWSEKEIIVNEKQGKDEFEWAYLLKSAMEQSFRVLKPGHWISLCYHDTSEGTWQLVQDIMSEVGFISEKGESSLFIDTGGKTYNQTQAGKVTKRDLVINFRKPREGELAAKMMLAGDENATSFGEKARLILREALERHPGLPADRIYDELVSRMVRKGQFQRHNFDELLRTVAEETGGRWYLLETADQLDETETKKENAAASRLETFMQKYLQSYPGEYGVHYSNLFEEYLPIGDKPRRLMQDWLPEYFFKTEDGTWRPPSNEDERQQKISLRLSGELRHIKRFANALSAGVPPAERDRPSNVATLTEWIYQCRRSGLYDVGRILYERGGLRFDGLKEVQQLQVEEDYQICVKRGSSNEKKSTRKDKVRPELF